MHLTTTGKLIVGAGVLVAALIHLSRRYEIVLINQKPPTVDQLSRRFIEFFPEHAVPAVISHFITLVGAGVEPTHAFTMIARKAEPDDD